MGEYGPGMSFGQVCMLHKERVRHALAGELAAGDGENGFIYLPAEKGECDRFILGVVDELYFQGKRAMDAGRAIERLMANHGLKLGEDYSLKEYTALMEEAALEYNDYVYEINLDDLSWGNGE